MTESDFEEDYEVECIEDVKESPSGDFTYFIKWKGYPSEENTWEHSRNMQCPDILKNFWESRRLEEEGNTIDVGEEGKEGMSVDDGNMEEKDMGNHANIQKKRKIFDVNIEEGGKEIHVNNIQKQGKEIHVDTILTGYNGVLDEGKLNEIHIANSHEECSLVQSWIQEYAKKNNFTHILSALDYDSFKCDSRDLIRSALVLLLELYPPLDCDRILDIIHLLPFVHENSDHADLVQEGVRQLSLRVYSADTVYLESLIQVIPAEHVHVFNQVQKLDCVEVNIVEKVHSWDRFVQQTRKRLSEKVNGVTTLERLGALEISNDFGIWAFSNFKSNLQDVIEEIGKTPEEIQKIWPSVLL